MMDVLFVAAKKELVDDYASAVRNAGLKPMLMDIDVFALETMYEVNYPDAPESIVALVDAGASMININVLKDGMSIFARDISMGGRQLTERIQREFGVSYERAENIKTGSTSRASISKGSTTSSRWLRKRMFRRFAGPSISSCPPWSMRTSRGSTCPADHAEYPD